jgi:FkbM family methyltransferase
MEPGTLKVLRNLLNEGDVMIDVGANIGSLAIVAARCVGASGRVVAFEPTPRVADLLRRSAALNDLTARLQVEQCAAGEVDGEATFSISASTTHNSLFLEEGERILIAVRSIDSLIPPGGKVDLIKIDAEGSELQVWRGMQRVIANNPELAVIVEFGPSHLRRAGVTVASWLAELQTSGFVAWEIDEASGTVHPLRKQGLHEIFSLNLLLLRDPPSSRLGLRPT